MFDKQSTGLITYFFKAYPQRTIIMILCLIVAGLTEGIGIAVLLPLLETNMGGEGSPRSELGQYITDMIQALGLSPRFEVFVLILLLGMTLKGAFSWLAMRQVGYTVAHVVADLRMKLISALLSARWNYFISHPAGRFANAIGVEAWRSAQAYYEGCVAISFFIQLLFYTVVAIMVSWQVAAVAFAAGFIVMFTFRRFIKAGRQAGKRQTDLLKGLVSRLTDALQGIKPIKAMAGETHLLPLLKAETEDLNQAQRHMVLAQETLRALYQPVTAFFLGAGLLVMVVWAEMPFSTVLVLALVFFRIMTRFNEVQYRYQKMATFESAFWSLMKTIQWAEAEAEPRIGVEHAPSFLNAIRFENVFFGYGDREVLKKVSLTIPVGDFIGISGPSGAGKTTLADLLIGLEHPRQGIITIDDVPMGEISLTAWRKQVGYVPQEIFLFHETIYKNIVLGDTSISRSDVEKALKAAGAWKFVSCLPQGMDTLIGERGGRISGGERQRIAITMALVRKPRLLILDEVTTALDPATEAEICETLRNLAGSVTIVAISHQSALMKEARTLYRISDGYVEKVN